MEWYRIRQSKVLQSMDNENLQLLLVEILAWGLSELSEIRASV